MNEHGPQTEEIKKFLERVRNLTPEQAEGLESAWWNVRNTAWDAARNTAWDAVQKVVSDVVWENTMKDTMDDARIVIGGFAWNVVVIAVLALVVKDRISEEYFNTLYGPWKSVMEK